MNCPFLSRSLRFESAEPRLLLAVDMVADLGTLGLASSPNWIQVIGDQVVFEARTDVNGRQIYVSDGTEDGTQSIATPLQYGLSRAFETPEGIYYLSVRDEGGRSLTGLSIIDAVGGENPRELLTSGFVSNGDTAFQLGSPVYQDGLLYTFDRLNRNTTYRGIVVSDGTVSGTRQIGGELDRLTEMVAFRGTVYVSQESGISRKLPTSDDFVPIPDSSAPANLTVAGDRLFFSRWIDESSTQLWVMDGETSELVADFGNERLALQLVPNDQDGVHIRVENYETDVIQLWTSDGTTNGTRLVRQEVGPQEIGIPVVHDGATYFGTGKSQAPEGNGAKLWKHVSGEEPELIQDGLPGIPMNMESVNGRLHFTSAGRYWISNGSTQGTHAVGPLQRRSFVGEANYTALDEQRVLFRGSEDGADWELWVSDGTPEGTHEVVDLRPGTSDADFSRVRGVHPSLERLGEHVYFGLLDGLYRTDGTEDGTQKVVHFNVDILLNRPDAEIIDLIAIEDRLFFHVLRPAAQDRPAMAEIWSMQADSDPRVVWSAESASIGELNELGGELLFRYVDLNAELADRIPQLWLSDGTPEGTRFMRQSTAFHVDTTSTRQMSVYSLTDLGGQRAREIGVVDHVTNVPSTIIAFNQPSDPVVNELVLVNDHVLFAQTNILWLTDGTEAGTTPAFEFSHSIRGLVATDDVAYIAEGSEPYRLWKTDGTAEGTVMIHEGPRFTSATIVGRELFFQEYDGTHTTLMRFDTTSNETVPLRRSARQAANFVAAADEVFFTGYDQEYGNELWSTDGTEAGTQLVADIFPGTDSSSPSRLFPFDNGLLFTATDPMYGEELWRYTPDRAAGDLNGDNVVDDADFFVLAENFGRNDADTRSTHGDLDENGRVDFADFLMLANAIGGK